MSGGPPGSEDAAEDGNGIGRGYGNVAGLRRAERGPGRCGRGQTEHQQVRRRSGEREDAGPGKSGHLVPLQERKKDDPAEQAGPDFIHHRLERRQAEHALTDREPGGWRSLGRSARKETQRDQVGENGGG